MKKVMLGLLILILVFITLQVILVSYPLVKTGVKINLPEKEIIKESSLLTIQIEQDTYTASYKDNLNSNKDLEILLKNYQDLVSLNPNQEIAISADEKVEYTKVMKVMVLLQTVGYKNIRFIKSNVNE